MVASQLKSQNYFIAEAPSSLTHTWTSPLTRIVSFHVQAKQLANLIESHQPRPGETSDQPQALPLLSRVSQQDTCTGESSRGISFIPFPTPPTPPPPPPHAKQLANLIESHQPRPGETSVQPQALPLLPSVSQQDTCTGESSRGIQSCQPLRKNRICYEIWKGIRKYENTKVHPKSTILASYGTRMLPPFISDRKSKHPTFILA